MLYRLLFKSFLVETSFALLRVNTSQVIRTLLIPKKWQFSGLFSRNFCSVPRWTRRLSIPLSNLVQGLKMVVAELQNISQFQLRYLPLGSVNSLINHILSMLSNWIKFWWRCLNILIGFNWLFWELMKLSTTFIKKYLSTVLTRFSSLTSLFFTTCWKA